MAQRHKNPTVAPLVQVNVRLHLLCIDDRHVKVGIEKHESPMEVRWRYSDNRKRMLVHLDNAAHYTAIAGKLVVPISVAQHDVGSAVWSVLVRLVNQPAK